MEQVDDNTFSETKSDIIEVKTPQEINLEEVDPVVTRKGRKNCLEIASLVASTWSDEESERAEIVGEEDGYVTVDEVQEIEDELWEVVDEYNDEDENKTEETGTVYIDNSSYDKTTEDKSKSLVEASRLTKEHLDNISVTVDQERNQRTVEATRLTRDLRIYSQHFPPKKVENIPSGDKEFQQPECIIILPPQNILPRGITSYERIPHELLPANTKFCPICELPKRFHIKRHILQTHFPWFWSPTTACWTCKEQSAQQSTVTCQHTMGHYHKEENQTFDNANLHKWCQLINGSLFLLVCWLELDTLEDLYNYVISRKLTNGVTGTFTDKEIRCMTFYSENYSPTPYSTFRISPPNHDICFIHHQIITRLLNRVKTEERLLQFKTSDKLMTSDGLNVTVKIPEEIPRFEFIDTHFHLDLLLHASEHSNWRCFGFWIPVFKYIFQYFQQLHCFLGDGEEFKEWQRLPRIIFGISGKICKIDNEMLKAVTSRIPDHQLVLETDSPFLVPVAGAKINHPWNLITIAQTVSRIRNVPLMFLMDIVNNNARYFYQL
ncbi:tatD [Mytilus coruscus]|uniref:TatD n=1 Tax=Mytilus coruscus TaxID=42192 RepID=A0A6J8DQ46_MYTCO|nr:tatD [Mytilus coruscus]